MAKLETRRAEFNQALVEEVEEVEEEEEVEYELTGPLHLYSLRGTGRSVQRSEDFVAWLAESILGEFVR